VLAQLGLALLVVVGRLEEITPAMVADLAVQAESGLPVSLGF
jgi:hypothetical protein